MIDPDAQTSLRKAMENSLNWKQRNEIPESKWDSEWTRMVKWLSTLFTRN